MTKRQMVIAIVLGTGMTVTGCQAPSLGGLAFWNKGDTATHASATPDVRSQKYAGLAKEFGGTEPSVAVGHPRPGTSPLGGPAASSSDNFFVTSWKKTTAAVGGAFAGRPQDGAVDDPLRLDNQPKKVGPEVYVAAGRLLENQGKYAEAEGQYNKALSMAPNDVSAMVGLARLYDRQGHPAKAIELYHRALKADPASAMAYNDLGLCHARQRQVDKSLMALGKAVQLQPDNAKYRNNLATVLVDAGRTDEALRELSMLGSPAVAHYNIGYLLHKKGNTPEALRHFQQALALDPALTPAQDMLTELAGRQPAPPSLAAAPQPAMQGQPAASTYIYAPNQTTSSAVSASLNDAAPARAGSAFHIGDDDSRVTGSGYGAPRPLPPVE
jgi:tetratricopeptide (TPR) repeat protein